MKILLFIAILFILFLFPSCSEPAPIVGDICEITTEICYYANLVCDNLNKKEMNFQKNASALNHVSFIRNEIKEINSDLNSENMRFTQDEIEAYRKRLFELKIELIKMYEQTK